MRYVHKLNQPDSLITYKNDPNASYDNLPKNVKNDLKSNLLTEQGHVCAYCMNRIKAETMRIEHWACQENNDHLGLDYNNLLGCCDGNERKGQSSQYICDKKKENKTLTYSPANPAHSINQRIKYNHSIGKIHSDEVNFDRELNEILNLNEARLISNRKSALNAIQSELSKKNGTRSKQDIRKLLNSITSLDAQGRRRPFFGFLADYLSRKL